MIKFVDSSDNSTLVFENKVIYIDESSPLFVDIRKPNYENEESTFKFGFADEEETLVPIYDVIQVKVNIKNVGELLLSFNKESFVKDIRQELLGKLSSLKDIDVEQSFEALNEKIVKAIEFVKEYNPLFGVFTIERHVDEVSKIINEDLLSFPLFIYKNEKVVEVVPEIIEPVVNNEEEHVDEFNLGGNTEENTESNKKHRIKKEKSNKPKVEGVYTFKDALLNIKRCNTEHIVNALYCAMIAVVSFFSIVFFSHGEPGNGIIFVLFVIAFIGLLSYDIFQIKKEIKVIHWIDNVIFAVIVVACVALGITIAYLISDNLLSFESSTDYSLCFILSIIISVVGICSSQGIAVLSRLYLVPYIEKKKLERKEKEENENENKE